LLAASGLFAVACDDPAKNATKAVTTEAVPAAGSAAVQTRPAEGATRYAFDASDGSKVEWVGSKVTGSHDGGFKAFKGTASLVEGDPAKGRVEVEIDARSIWSDTEKLTTHLKSEDFFDV